MGEMSSICVDKEIFFIVLYGISTIAFAVFVASMKEEEKEEEKRYKIILEDEKEVYFYRFILNILKNKKETYNLLINVNIKKIGLPFKKKATFVVTNKLSQPLIFIFNKKDIEEKNLKKLQETYPHFTFCSVDLDNKIKAQYKIMGLLEKLD